MVKLEDPKVNSIKLLKDIARTETSFRSTCYTVASRRGIPIKIEKVAPNVYEITRSKRDTVSEFTGELKVSKEMKISTYSFSSDILAAAIIFLRERVVSSVEFVSFGTSDIEPLKGNLDDMGLTGALEELVKENTENSLIVRVKTDRDLLMEPSPV